MNIPDTSGDVWDNLFADTRGTELAMEGEDFYHLPLDPDDE